MSAGLAIFIAVVLLDGCGLLLDALLTFLDSTSVTHVVRQGNWLLGVAIIAVQLVGVAGLAHHFWGMTA